MKPKSAVIIILVLFLTFLPVFANAEPAPAAYTFAFTNLGAGGSAAIYEQLSGMGYSTSIETDWTAPMVLDTLGSSAVFTYVGHGDAGRLTCDGNTQISAIIVPGEENIYSIQQKYSLDPEKLTRSRMVYYGSCYSDTYSAKYGRLTTFTSNLGANAVVGFDGSVNSEVATLFETMLFDYLQQGKTVTTSLGLAKADSQAGYPAVFGYSNVQTAIVFGNGDTYLIPPAYGV